MIFAMEVVLLEYSVIGFMPVIVSAATGALVVQLMFGRELVLTVPAMHIESLHEIPYIVFLGVMIGLLAVVFISLMRATAKWADHSVLSYRSKLMLAGLATGCCAVFYPQVMGIGYDTVGAVLDGQLGIQLLIGILISKCLLTPVVLALGVPAGLIGPAIFIGAIGGGLLGILGAQAVDLNVAHSGFYALLGMASMMGAVTNAPMAALVATLELTGNPNIIFPAMISIVISNLIARYVFNLPSVFITSMRLQGLDYHYNPLNQILNRAAVRSLMLTDYVKSAPLISAQGASNALSNNPSWILLEDADKFTLLSPGDLHHQVRTAESADQDIDMLTIPGLRLDTARIDSRSTLQQALDCMKEQQVEALCITNIRGQVIGLLTREQIEDFYRKN